MEAPCGVVEDVSELISFNLSKNQPLLRSKLKPAEKMHEKLSIKSPWGLIMEAGICSKGHVIEVASRFTYRRQRYFKERACLEL